MVPSHPVTVFVADRSACKGSKWGSVIGAATSGSTASASAPPTVTILPTASEMEMTTVDALGTTNNSKDPVGCPGADANVSDIG